jgi:hypothetical protein
VLVIYLLLQTKLWTQNKYQMKRFRGFWSQCQIKIAEWNLKVVELIKKN